MSVVILCYERAEDAADVINNAKRSPQRFTVIEGHESEYVRIHRKMLYVFMFSVGVAMIFGLFTKIRMFCITVLAIDLVCVMILMYHDSMRFVQKSKGIICAEYVAVHSGPMLITCCQTADDINVVKAECNRIGRQVYIISVRTDDVSLPGIECFNVADNHVFAVNRICALLRSRV